MQYGMGRVHRRTTKEQGPRNGRDDVDQIVAGKQEHQARPDEKRSRGRIYPRRIRRRLLGPDQRQRDESQGSCFEGHGPQRVPAMLKCNGQGTGFRASTPIRDQVRRDIPRDGILC